VKSAPRNLSPPGSTLNFARTNVANNIIEIGVIAENNKAHGSIMRISIIVIGIVVAAYSTSVRAYDYKDAAYCVGGLQSEIESRDRLVKGWKASQDVLNNDIRQDALKSLRDLKINLFVHETIVKHAIERGEIDAVMASKMKSNGYDDGNVCNKAFEKCMDELDDRIDKKIGDEVSNEMYKSCASGPMKYCDKIRKACE
jgi:hypothetical protein